MCINWGLIWEVGVGEGLGMRDLRSDSTLAHVYTERRERLNLLKNGH